MMLCQEYVVWIAKKANIHYFVCTAVVIPAGNDLIEFAEQTRGLGSGTSARKHRHRCRICLEKIGPICYGGTIGDLW